MTSVDFDTYFGVGLFTIIGVLVLYFLGTGIWGSVLPPFHTPRALRIPLRVLIGAVALAAAFATTGALGWFVVSVIRLIPR